MFSARPASSCRRERGEARERVGRADWIDLAPAAKVEPGTAGSVNLVGWDDSVIDFYVPVFTLLQFVFYFGWLQVFDIRSR